MSGWETSAVGMTLTEPVVSGEPGAAVRRAVSWPVWPALVLVGLPLVVAGCRVLADGWVPVGDLAIEVLRASEVGTRHTPLVGAWSRWGWDHPGPLLFWVSAPAYQVFGPVGMAVTAGVVNALSAVCVVVAARRIGGANLAWLAAAAVALVASSLDNTVVYPWNPYVAILPFMAYLLCAWGAAAGVRWLLLGAVVAGSYCVQAHVGFLAPVAAAAALSTVVGVVRWRRGGPHVGARTLLVAAAVGLVLWSGPLLQQATVKGGNLRSIWDFLHSTDAPSAGWDRAVRVAGQEFGLPAPWLGAHEANSVGWAVEADPTVAIVLLTIAAAVGILAWRRGDRQAAAFVAFAVAVVAVSVVAISNTTGALAPYLVRWTWPVAALVWVATLWGGGRLARRPGLTRGITALAVAMTLVVGTIATVRAASMTLPRNEDSRAVASLSQQVRADLDDDVGYQVTWIDTRGWGAVGTGLAVDLQLRGWDVRVPERREHTFRRWWTVSSTWDGANLVVVSAYDRDEWDPPAGADRVATYDPRTRDATPPDDASLYTHEVWLLLPGADETSGG
jgi:hypothetical protein